MHCTAHKKVFNLVRGIKFRSRNIYRAMARMQTNQMKATEAICYVHAWNIRLLLIWLVGIGGIQR